MFVGLRDADQESTFHGVHGRKPCQRYLAEAVGLFRKNVQLGMNETFPKKTLRPYNCAGFIDDIYSTSKR